MKAKTQLKDVTVLVDDGRLVNMIIDGDMMRVESVIYNVSKITGRVLNCYCVYDLNTETMVVDNSKILSAFVGVNRP